MKKREKISILLVCFAMVIGLFGMAFRASASADSTIYCSECGKKIDANSKFCMYCGHKISTASQQATAKPAATAAPASKSTGSAYIIGDSENTFAGLYKRMCVNLDLKKNPIPKPEENMGAFGDETLYATVLKDDDDSYEYIGYLRSGDGKDRYICRSWTGYHQDGSTIGMLVFYTTDGRYIGNIQRDLTAGTSTSSHNSPYFVPGEPLNKA